ncbi:MAG: hypothetical protein WCF03_20480 [Nitrososphaeraceae archaeon]
MTYYDYHFREEELREGCIRSVDNVKGLLRSSSLLLENRDSLQYALGLYVYAVEEFGKALLLKKYITGNKKKYLIPGWIIGKGNPSIASIKADSILSNLLTKHLGNRKFKPDDIMLAHNAKLFIGSDDLPPECSHITRGVWISRPNPSGKVIKIGSNRSVFTSSNLTGGFSDTTHIHFDTENMTFFELDIKTSCFYMDFDKDNKTWKYNIFPDKAQLKKIIKRFEETLNNFSCN